MPTNSILPNKALRILSLGAGVQSSTLLYMMLEGEIEMADHAIFADTGWEPQNVYDHLTYLKALMDQAGLPLHIVSNGNLRDDFSTDKIREISMPLYLLDASGKKSIIRRQCTNKYKLKPLYKKMRELVDLQPKQRSTKHLANCIIGISWDEYQRMKDPYYPWIVNQYPLVDRHITRSDCFKWIAQRKYLMPPRSACIGCPYKTDAEWRDVKSKANEWKDVVTFDNALRTRIDLKERFRSQLFLHRSCKPLDEVDLRNDDELGILHLFDNECEGMCGL